MEAAPRLSMCALSSRRPASEGAQGTSCRDKDRATATWSSQVHPLTVSQPLTRNQRALRQPAARTVAQNYRDRRSPLEEVHPLAADRFALAFGGRPDQDRPLVWVAAPTARACVFEVLAASCAATHSSRSSVASERAVVAPAPTAPQAIATAIAPITKPRIASYSTAIGTSSPDTQSARAARSRSPNVVAEFRRLA